MDNASRDSVLLRQSLHRVDLPHVQVVTTHVTPKDEESDRPRNRKLSGDQSPTNNSSEGERLRRHARQLATLLRARQQELDRREAMLNARQAQLEDEQRAARLWVREQIEAQACQQKLVDQQARELSERFASLAAEVAEEKRRQESREQTQPWR